MTVSTNYVDPCVSPSRETVLDAIHYVESRCGERTDLYPHPDRKSWGEYGMTQAARDELVRIGKIIPEIELGQVAGRDASESVQREYAGMYLDHCFDIARRGDVRGPAATWLDAALIYHGWVEMRDGERYGQSIRNAIERAARQAGRRGLK